MDAETYNLARTDLRVNLNCTPKTSLIYFTGQNFPPKKWA